MKKQECAIMKLLHRPMTLNNLKHEIHIPVAIIREEITSLLDNEALTAEQKLCLKELHDAANALLALFNKLACLAEKIKLQPPPQNSTKFSNANCKVLLVEDTPILQMVHKKMLENLGVFVELAKSGEEALDKINLMAYTVIFMDLGLPGISGTETALQIRRSASSNQHTPIIALTGLSDIQTKKACLDAGINLFENKPIAREKLAELISYFYQAPLAATS